MSLLQTRFALSVFSVIETSFSTRATFDGTNKYKLDNYQCQQKEATSQTFVHNLFTWFYTFSRYLEISTFISHLSTQTSQVKGNYTAQSKMGKDWIAGKTLADSDEFLAKTDKRRLTERLTACGGWPHCPLPPQSKRSCGPQWGPHPVPQWWPPC